MRGFAVRVGAIALVAGLASLGRAATDAAMLVARVPEHQTASMRQDRALVLIDDRAELAQIVERALRLQQRVEVGIFVMRQVDGEIRLALADAEQRDVLAGLQQLPRFGDGRQQRAVVLHMRQVLVAPDRHQMRLGVGEALRQPGCILAAVGEAVERRARVPETLRHGTISFVAGCASYLTLRLIAARRLQQQRSATAARSWARIALGR